MLELTNVTKQFGKLTAVEDLTLSVPRGTIMGFLGPNGAGKTTTMRMVAGMMEPDTGEILVDGHDAVENPEAVRRLLGYMPDFFGLYDDLKVWEYLDFFAAAYDVPSDKRHGLVNDVLELTDLTGKRDAYVESISRGMKQRLCLAKTLVHDPQLLLLDEPASGLDPHARIELRVLLKELQAMNKTILISSHILTELTGLCDQLAIIEKGKLLSSGPVNAMIDQISPNKSWLVAVAGDLNAAIETASAIDGVTIRDPLEKSFTIELSDGRTDGHTVLRILVESGVDVDEFRRVESGVEELFLRITKGEVS